MARETLDSNSLNSTPSANRVHISFFGRRNAGKSSLLNALTGQNLAIVSELKGTTSDPVSKAMELLPLGPVVITDTPGIDDDDGMVGEKRIEKALLVLAKTDAAVLVIDSLLGPGAEDLALIEKFKEKKIPYITVYNKSDLIKACGDTLPGICVSAETGSGVDTLKEAIVKLVQSQAAKSPQRYILGDIIGPDQLVVLVTPIDESAPKGRMILPQVQTIRDILDSHACCMVTQVEELEHCLNMLKEPPALVVTDSQAFNLVKDMVPAGVPLTSFSILFARFKGILETAVHGAHFLPSLKDGDKVLISEGCTHHRQCEDIGTVKLPGWIEKNSGRTLNFEFTSGGEFPQTAEALQEYALIVHCGGCMLNEREMLHRMTLAENAGVPFTNYGTLIAQMNGILDRSTEIFDF